jgi:hypothetical protein
VTGTTIKKQKKKVSKELARVDGTLRTLSRGVRRSRAPEAPPTKKTAAPSSGRSRSGRKRHKLDAAIADASTLLGPRSSNERFLDYLSASFSPARPMKHERRQQRTRAIVTVVLAGLATYWLVNRLFIL